MGRISIESVEESRRINRSISENGMRETVRSVMEEKGLDCPSAKDYVNRHR